MKWLTNLFKRKQRYFIVIRFNGLHFHWWRVSERSVSNYKDMFRSSDKLYIFEVKRELSRKEFFGD